MRVLGVDPGSWTTGWGLVGGDAARPHLLECGLIQLSKGAEDFASRMARLQLQFGELVERLQPTTSAVESPFHGSNPRSALQLAHARGVVLAILASAGLEVREYTPATVKKSVTGNGRAPKDQVRIMVGRLLGGTTAMTSSDSSDALAVALCHATASRYRAALERSR